MDSAIVAKSVIVPLLILTMIVLYIYLFKVESRSYKMIIIPRLELCGAVLLAKSFSHVTRVFRSEIQFYKIYAWCDSTILLCSIRSSPHRFKTFVSNHVTYIQDKVLSSSGTYVRSKNNLANVVS